MSAGADHELGVPTRDLVVDTTLRSRVGGLDLGHARALPEATEDRSPLVVVRRDGRHVLLDGFHRLAARNLGLGQAPVRVVDVPPDGDPYVLVFALNAVHGRPLSLADRATDRRCGLTSNAI